jgi:hypothetical protein
MQGLWQPRLHNIMLTQSMYWDSIAEDKIISTLMKALNQWGEMGNMLIDEVQRLWRWSHSKAASGKCQPLSVIVRT